MLLYDIIFVAAVVLVFYIFDDVVVRTIFCSLNISTSPRVFSRVFSHTAQAVFYRCPLSISLLLTERPVLSLVQSRNAN